MNKQILFRYSSSTGDIRSSDNPNGSLNNIAGITNKEGNVLGMMPHPERACKKILGSDDGLIILESIIKQNLENLNMLKTQFKINLSSDQNNILESGMDVCEFFISTNIGEELRPVSKVASGGEISRIMLAIKMALQSKDIVSSNCGDKNPMVGS